MLLLGVMFTRMDLASSGDGVALAGYWKTAGRIIIGGFLFKVLVRFPLAGMLGSLIVLAGLAAAYIYAGETITAATWSEGGG